MIKKIDITSRKIAEDVLNIQLPSYQVEADIIGYDDIPPLKDTVETLQQCGETFYGYYLNEELCGAISLKVEEGEVDIHRLIVHPNHIRKGIAQTLFNYLESHLKGNRMIVATGSKNTPAIRFYKKNGFEMMKEVIVNDRLSLTYFEKSENEK